MQIGFLDVFITVFSLVIMAVPGYILVKTKLLPESGSGPLSTFVLYASQTLLVFMSFQKDNYTPQIGVNMLWCLLLTAVVYIAMACIMYLCVRNKNKEARLDCVRYASVFSNAGFMGFPLLDALYSGQEILGEVMLYAGAVVAMFNVLNWTLGVFMMTGDRKEISLKKIFLNPVIIAVVIGFVLLVTIQKPLYDVAPEGSTVDSIVTKLLDKLNDIGQTVTPLSMAVIGMKLASVNLKELFLDKWAYVTAFFKLIAMSLLTILIVAWLPVAEPVKYVMFFLMSMPSAASATLFAVKFNKDSKSASVYLLLNTVLSILTVSVMFLLFKAVVG